MGGVFVKRGEMGVFCKKVENGRCFFCKKSGKWGVFCKKQKMGFFVESGNWGL